MNYTIKCNDFRAVINSVGAELISLKSKEKEYIWQGGENFWCEHAPLLFPTCGRLLDETYTYNETKYKLEIHGFLRFMEFSLAEKSDDYIKFTFKSNDETRKLYPFDFSLFVEYKISENGIDFNCEIKNECDECMPYMFGWHPGFNIPDNVTDCSFSFDTDFLSIHPIQNEGFVSPDCRELSLENGFYHIKDEQEFYDAQTVILTGHKNSTTLSFKSVDTKISVSWSENLPYLCLWKDFDPMAKFICIEPWSDVPSDGVTKENFEYKKMQRLGAGEKSLYSYSVRIKE